MFVTIVRSGRSVPVATGGGRARESKAAGEPSESERAEVAASECAPLRRSPGGEGEPDSGKVQIECNSVTSADLARAAVEATGDRRAARLLLLDALRALEDGP